MSCEDPVSKGESVPLNMPSSETEKSKASGHAHSVQRNAFTWRYTGASFWRHVEDLYVSMTRSGLRIPTLCPQDKGDVAGVSPWDWRGRGGRRKSVSADGGCLDVKASPLEAVVLRRGGFCGSFTGLGD